MRLERAIRFRTSRRLEWLVAIGVGVCALGPAPAFAQGDASDRAVAEGLFRDGKKLMASGDVSSACAKFAESYKLVAKLGTLLNLATCHEKEGKIASAWSEFSDAASQAMRSQQDERAKYAREHAQALEQKLTKAIIEVKAPVDGLVVNLDGHAVGEAAWGTPVPIDPGDHRLEATAPGRRAWSITVHVDAGAATQTIAVPALEVEDKAASPAAPGASHEPSTGADEGSKSSGRTQRAVGVVLIGVGVAGIAVGGYFGVRTFSKEHDSEPHCVDTTCDGTGVDLRADAHRSATISDIAFGAGLAFAVTGAVVVLTAPSSSRARSAWIAPAAGPGGAHVRIGTAW